MSEAVSTRTSVKDASIVFTLPLNGNLNTLTIPGRIFNIVQSTRSTDKALSTFCPDCEAPIEYPAYCTNGHGPIDRATVLKGKVIDNGDTTTVAIVENATEVKQTDIAKGKLTLTPVSRQSLVDGTTPDGTPYHFMPIPADTADKEAYDILYSSIVDNPDWAFVCRANIRKGAETLISVEAGAYGGLTLQNLAYPEVLYGLPEYEVTPLTRTNKRNVRTLLEPLVGEFDPTEWNDRQAAAIAEAVKEAVATPGNRKGSTPKVKKPKPAAQSLLSAIANAAAQQAS